MFPIIFGSRPRIQVAQGGFSPTDITGLLEEELPDMEELIIEIIPEDTPVLVPEEPEEVYVEADKPPLVTVFGRQMPLMSDTLWRITRPIRQLFSGE